MQKTAISILGTNLDSGLSPRRWQKWRPTVAACQHEDLLLHQLEILYPIGHEELANTIKRDIADVSPETDVRLHEMTFRDPWDFEEVFTGLHDFASSYPFQTRDNEYLFNITTGTHVQQICLFLLTESRHLPGKLLQLSPPGSKPKERIQGVGPKLTSTCRATMHWPCVSPQKASRARTS